jgi:hypothetical protein
MLTKYQWGWILILFGLMVIIISQMVPNDCFLLGYTPCPTCGAPCNNQEIYCIAGIRELWIWGLQFIIWGIIWTTNVFKK